MQETGHDVTDRVQTVHGRAESFVGDDKSLVEVDSVFCETATVRAGDRGRRRPTVGRCRISFRRPVRRGPNRLLLSRKQPLCLSYRRFHVSGMPAPAASTTTDPRRRSVGGECLDDRYFGAERAPEACELDADDTATEYRCAGGHPVEFECLVAGDDPSAEFDAGEFPRIASRWPERVDVPV